MSFLATLFSQSRFEKKPRIMAARREVAGRVRELVSGISLGLRQQRKSCTHSLSASEKLEPRIALSVNTIVRETFVETDWDGDNLQVGIGKNNNPLEIPGLVTIASDLGSDVYIQQLQTDPTRLLVADNGSFLEYQAFEDVLRYDDIIVTNGSFQQSDQSEEIIADAWWLFEPEDFNPAGGDSRNTTKLALDRTNIYVGSNSPAGVSGPADFFGSVKIKQGDNTVSEWTFSSWDGGGTNNSDFRSVPTSNAYGQDLYITGGPGFGGRPESLQSVGLTPVQGREPGYIFPRSIKLQCLGSGEARRYYLTCEWSSPPTVPPVMEADYVGYVIRTSANSNPDTSLVRDYRSGSQPTVGVATVTQPLNFRIPESITGRSADGAPSLGIVPGTLSGTIEVGRSTEGQNPFKASFVDQATNVQASGGAGYQLFFTNPDQGINAKRSQGKLFTSFSPGVSTPIDSRIREDDTDRDTTGFESQEVQRHASISGTVADNSSIQFTISSNELNNVYEPNSENRSLDGINVDIVEADLQEGELFDTATNAVRIKDLEYLVFVKPTVSNDVIFTPGATIDRNVTVDLLADGSSIFVNSPIDVAATTSAGGAGDIDFRATNIHINAPTTTPNYMFVGRSESNTYARLPRVTDPQGGSEISPTFGVRISDEFTERQVTATPVLSDGRVVSLEVLPGNEGYGYDPTQTYRATITPPTIADAKIDILGISGGAGQLFLGSGGSGYLGGGSGETAVSFSAPQLKRVDSLRRWNNSSQAEGYTAAPVIAISQPEVVASPVRIGYGERARAESARGDGIVIELIDGGSNYVSAPNIKLQLSAASKLAGIPLYDPTIPSHFAPVLSVPALTPNMQINAKVTFGSGNTPPPPSVAYVSGRVDSLTVSSPGFGVNLQGLDPDSVTFLDDLNDRFDVVVSGGIPTTLRGTKVTNINDGTNYTIGATDGTSNFPTQAQVIHATVEITDAFLGTLAFQNTAVGKLPFYNAGENYELSPTVQAVTKLSANVVNEISDSALPKPLVRALRMATAVAEVGKPAELVVGLIGDEVDPNSYEIVFAGSGYQPNATDIELTFSLPDSPSGGIQAEGTATTDSNGRVISVNITNPGDGYISTPTIVVEKPTGIDPDSITITHASSKYDPNPSLPGVGSGLPNVDYISINFEEPKGKLPDGTDGITATGIATIDSLGRVTSIIVTNPGSGYRYTDNNESSPTFEEEILQEPIIRAEKAPDSRDRTVSLNNVLAYSDDRPDTDSSRYQKGVFRDVDYLSYINDPLFEDVTQVMFSRDGNTFHSVPLEKFTNLDGSFKVVDELSGQIGVTEPEPLDQTYDNLPFSEFIEQVTEVKIYFDESFVGLQVDGVLELYATMNVDPAEGRAVVSEGQVTALEVTYPGSGYTQSPTVIFPTAATTATATASVIGGIYELEVSSAGFNYPSVEVPGSQARALTVTMSDIFNPLGFEQANPIIDFGVRNTAIQGGNISFPGQGIELIGGRITNTGSSNIVVPGGRGVAPPDKPADYYAIVEPDGVVRRFRAKSQGEGYSLAPTVQVPAPPKARDATARAVIDASRGVVEEIKIKDTGNRYQVPPRVRVLPPNPRGEGVAATAEAILDMAGAVQRIVVTDGGSGYSSPPDVIVEKRFEFARSEFVDVASEISAQFYELYITQNTWTTRERGQLLLRPQAKLSSGQTQAGEPIRSDTIYIEASAADLVLEGDVAADQIMVLMQSRPEREMLAPFTVTTRSRATGQQSGSMQAEVLSLTLGNDIPTPAEGSSLTNTFDVSTVVDSLRVTAAESVADPRGAFPYALSVTEADDLVVDAVPRSGAAISFEVGKNLEIRSAVLTDGDVSVKAQTFSQSSPVVTTTGRISIEAEEVTVQNSLQVLSAPYDDDRVDILLTATQGPVELVGLIEAPNAIEIRQVGVSQSGETGVTGESRLSADRLRIRADGEIDVSTDVRSMVGFSVDSGIRISEIDDITFENLAAKNGLISLEALGVDRGAESDNPIAMSARILEATSVIASTPNGSMDIRVDSSDDINIGQRDITLLNAGDEMKAAGNVRITSSAGSVDVFDGPVAAASARQVRVATTGQLAESYTYQGNSPGAFPSTLTGSGRLPVIDGVSLEVGDRILVKDQVDDFDTNRFDESRANGIYVVKRLGGGDSGFRDWLLERAMSEDTRSDLLPGTFVRVLEGDKQAGIVLQTEYANVPELRVTRTENSQLVVAGRSSGILNLDVNDNVSGDGIIEGARVTGVDFANGVLTLGINNQVSVDSNDITTGDPEDPLDHDKIVIKPNKAGGDVFNARTDFLYESIQSGLNNGEVVLITGAGIDVGARVLQVALLSSQNLEITLDGNSISSKSDVSRVTFGFVSAASERVALNPAVRSFLITSQQDSELSGIFDIQEQSTGSTTAEDYLESPEVSLDIKLLGEGMAVSAKIDDNNPLTLDDALPPGTTITKIDTVRNTVTFSHAFTKSGVALLTFSDDGEEIGKSVDAVEQGNNKVEFFDFNKIEVGYKVEGPNIEQGAVVTQIDRDNGRIFLRPEDVLSSSDLRTIEFQRPFTQDTRDENDRIVKTVVNLGEKFTNYGSLREGQAVYGLGIKPGTVITKVLPAIRKIEVSPGGLPQEVLVEESTPLKIKNSKSDYYSQGFDNYIQMPDSWNDFYTIHIGQEVKGSNIRPGAVVTGIDPVYRQIGLRNGDVLQSDSINEVTFKAITTIDFSMIEETGTGVASFAVETFGYGGIDFKNPRVASGLATVKSTSAYTNELLVEGIEDKNYEGLEVLGGGLNDGFRIHSFNGRDLTLYSATASAVRAHSNGSVEDISEATASVFRYRVTLGDEFDSFSYLENGLQVSGTAVVAAIEDGTDASVIIHASDPSNRQVTFESDKQLSLEDLRDTGKYFVFETGIVEDVSDATDPEVFRYRVTLDEGFDSFSTLKSRSEVDGTLKDDVEVDGTAIVEAVNDGTTANVKLQSINSGSQQVTLESDKQLSIEALKDLDKYFVFGDILKAKFSVSESAQSAINIHRNTAAVSTFIGSDNPRQRVRYEVTNDAGGTEPGTLNSLVSLAQRNEFIELTEIDGQNPVIAFNPSVSEILLDQPLPEISERSLTIDGTVDLDGARTSRVTIDGRFISRTSTGQATIAGEEIDGLVLSSEQASGSVVRGIRLGGFNDGSMIRVDNEASGVLISDVELGRTAEGTRAGALYGVNVSGKSIDTTILNSQVVGATIAGIKFADGSTGSTVVGTTLGSTEGIINTTGLEVVASEARIGVQPIVPSVTTSAGSPKFYDAEFEAGSKAIDITAASSDWAKFSPGLAVFGLGLEEGTVIVSVDVANQQLIIDKSAVQDRLANGSILVGHAASGGTQSNRLELGDSVPLEHVFLGQQVSVVDGEDVGEVETGEIIGIDKEQRIVFLDKAFSRPGFYSGNARLVEFGAPTENLIQQNTTGLSVGLFGDASGVKNAETLVFNQSFRDYDSLFEGVKVFGKGIAPDTKISKIDAGVRSISLTKPLLERLDASPIYFAGADQTSVVNTTVRGNTDNGIVLGGGANHSIGVASELAVYPSRQSAESNLQPNEQVFELSSYDFTGNVSAIGELRITDDRVIDALRDVATVVLEDVTITLGESTVVNPGFDVKTLEGKTIEVSGDGVVPGTKVESVLLSDDGDQSITFTQTFTQNGIVSLRFLNEDAENLKKIKVYGEAIDPTTRVEKFNLANETIILTSTGQEISDAQLYFGLNRFVALDPSEENSFAVGMHVEGELSTIEANVGDNVTIGATQIPLDEAFTDGIALAAGFRVTGTGISPDTTVASYDSITNILTISQPLEFALDEGAVIQIMSTVTVPQYTKVEAIRAGYGSNNGTVPGYLVLSKPTDEEPNPLVLGKVGEGEIRIIQRNPVSNSISFNGGFGIAVGSTDDPSESFKQLVETWTVAGNYIDLELIRATGQAAFRTNLRGPLDESIFAKLPRTIDDGTGNPKDVLFSEFSKTDRYGNQYQQETTVVSNRDDFDPDNPDEPDPGPDPDVPDGPLPEIENPIWPVSPF